MRLHELEHVYYSVYPCIAGCITLAVELYYRSTMVPHDRHLDTVTFFLFNQWSEDLFLFRSIMGGVLIRLLLAQEY